MHVQAFLWATCSFLSKFVLASNVGADETAFMCKCLDSSEHSLLLYTKYMYGCR